MRARTGLMLAYLGLAAAWLLYCLYLDLRYELFPAVLVGGTKILLAATGLLAVLLLLIRWARKAMGFRRHGVRESRSR